jgi:Terminase large subunit, T4likevirus-type, N-terminal
MKPITPISPLRDIAYRLDPALWVREIVGENPTAWQEDFLRAPRGASILALTARQVGKTTAAAWAIAHAMVFIPRSLSVIACPAQRQSAEAVRRVRAVLDQAGAKFVSINVYGLELENGSRVLALPSDDDTIRGMTVDAWIVADEAARLSPDLIAALRPMRARRPQARFAMLSTAWSRVDPFWTAWAGGNPSWLRLQATADMPGAPFTTEFLEQERLDLGEQAFTREYLGIPGGGEASPFSWDLFERATQIRAPRVPLGPVFASPPPPPAVPIPNPFRQLRQSGAV